MPAVRSLNEGQSLNSGDTPAYPVGRGDRTADALNEGRSLNSGDTSTNAAMTATRMASPAQRRPESELRRHAAIDERRPLTAGPLNEGRSLNSGDTRPLTVLDVHPPGPLNEGRSLNSGDTTTGAGHAGLGDRRSTKAGV